jgi:hypothetical protein
MLTIALYVTAQEPAKSGLPKSSDPGSLTSPASSDRAGDPVLPSQQPAPAPAATPLSARQKLNFGLRAAFLNPGSYVGPAIDAVITEHREVKAPGKTGSDNFADGMSRYARAFGNTSSAELLGSGVYPVLFKQDPRYFPSPKRDFRSRVLYGASRAVVTRGDNGKSQVNFSRLLGNLTADALANIYERNVVRSRDRFGTPVEYERRIGVGTTFEAFGIATGVEAVTDVVFKEFDLLGKVRKLFKR